MENNSIFNRIIVIFKDVELFVYIYNFMLLNKKDSLFVDQFSGGEQPEDIHKCMSLGRTMCVQGLKHTHSRRGNRRLLSHNLSASLLVILCSLITLSSVQALNVADNVWLEGIGYREQEL
jgi:hypothetical protein